MTFKGRFHEHIIPDQLQMLNVSFQVPNVRQSFGGCGANIAYNLKLLGSQGYLMGTVGSDFSRYAAWMDQHSIERTDWLACNEYESSLIVERTGLSIE